MGITVAIRLTYFLLRPTSTINDVITGFLKLFIYFPLMSQTVKTNKRPFLSSPKFRQILGHQESISPLTLTLTSSNATPKAFN